jgi:hypothetical protein
VTAYTHVCNEEFVQRCIRSCKAFRQFSHFKLWFFSTWKSWQRVLEKENIEQQWTAVLCAFLVHFRTFQHHPKAGVWRGLPWSCKRWWVWYYPSGFDDAENRRSGNLPYS